MDDNRTPSSRFGLLILGAAIIMAMARRQSGSDAPSRPAVTAPPTFWMRMKDALGFLGPLLGLSASIGAIAYFQGESRVVVEVGPALTWTRLEWMRPDTIAELTPCLGPKLKSPDAYELNIAQMAGPNVMTSTHGLTLQHEPLRIVVMSLVPKAESPRVNFKEIRGISVEEANSLPIQLESQKCQAGFGPCRKSISGNNRASEIAHGAYRFHEYLRNVVGIRTPELPPSIYNTYLLSDDPFPGCVDSLSLSAQLDFFRAIANNRVYWNRIEVKNTSSHGHSPVSLYLDTDGTEIEPVEKSIRAEGGEIIFASSKHVAIRFPTLIGNGSKNIIVRSLGRPLTEGEVHPEYQPVRSASPALLSGLLFLSASISTIYFVAISKK